MNYVLIDLEMGEVDPKDRERLGGMAKEVIQLGAVLVDEGFTITKEFNSYVKPQIGYVSRYVQRMTGISNGALRRAPGFPEVLQAFAQWLPEGQIIAMSWSDSDARQLRGEMRAKKLREKKVETLLSGWVDLQTDFGHLLGLRERCALSDALRICHIPAEGREHDGLCDARNTAKLFVKVMRTKGLTFSLRPIKEGGRTASGSTLPKRWTPERVLFALRHGRKAAFGDSYAKHQFEKRMRRVKFIS